ncbi:MAG: hypothetical protein M1820_006561 [Bogoriella megaspora]|nr:MAG: hypothetical protein M1820_006561 [Bogoriella megaspora]
METLLSPAFDNLSSKDINRVRKGLRQTEGLLAQLCLPTAPSPSKRRPSALPLVGLGAPILKSLEDLTSDRAYIYFFKLQESFEWNVTSRLLPALEHLLSTPPTSPVDSLILSTLTLLQGLLLLHPPSRHLLTPSMPMTSLVDLLDAANPPPIQSAAITLLIIALLGCPTNTRSFERLDGPRTVCSLFNTKSTTKDVKVKATEFLHFYLMPEAPERSLNTEDGEEGQRARSKSAPSTAVTPEGEAANLMGVFSRSLDHDGMREAKQWDLRMVRSVKKKQELLGRYLGNVDILMKDMKSKPGIVAEVC